MRSRLSLIVLIILAPPDRGFALSAQIALNLSHSLTQIAHTAWTVRDGSLQGSPRVLAQTKDGYLWVATDSELLRFDGFAFSAWRLPRGYWGSDTTIVTLLADADGALWLGSTSGLGRLKDGAFSAVAELAGQTVSALAQTSDGTVWAGTNGGNRPAILCGVGSRVICSHNAQRFGNYILSLRQAANGTLWVAAATGLWRWQETDPQRFDPPPGFREIRSMLDEADGLLMAESRSILRFADGRFTSLRIAVDALKPTALLRDRHQGLWIGTQDQGLIRIRGDLIDRFDRANGLSGNFVVDLFEDPEGNVWVATLNGVDRFRDVAAARIPMPGGPANTTVGAVERSGRGAVWVTTLAGLFRWEDGVLRPPPFAGFSGRDGMGSLLEDASGRLWVSTQNGLFVVEPGNPVANRVLATRHVQAMAEDGTGGVWLSEQDQGLIHRTADARVEIVPWSTFGGQDARALAAARGGGLWIGFWQGGVVEYRAGKIVRSFGPRDGLAEGRIHFLHVDQDGALWAATQSGVSRISDQRVITIRTDALPCAAVQWVIRDREGALWIHTACGLAWVPGSDLASWLSDASVRGGTRIYDRSDGVLPYADLGGYGPKVTVALDGRLWFASYDGAFVIDPAILPPAAPPPPVHILSALADRTPRDVSTAATLDAGARDLRIDYTAVSLGAPEKVRFRYRLEGRDPDWVDAGARRQAFFTDLPPGDYRFEVIAAVDGSWSEAPATWAFSIAPMLYQTTWFRIAFALVAVATLWALYRLKLLRLEAQLKVRYDERLAERTRIAQDLHDTLLQGFISSSMQLHFLADEIADPHARGKLAGIVGRIHDVLDEGRRAVSGLRREDTTPLEEALERDGQFLKGDQAVELRIAVIGRPRSVAPLVRDAVYYVAREALANTFRHAHATRVEVDVEYGARSLRVSVRDNGHGIDQQVIDGGKSGHWGLPGMRMRVDQIGGSFAVWSRAGAGTEIAVTVPAAIAFPN